MALTLLPYLMPSVFLYVNIDFAKLYTLEDSSLFAFLSVYVFLHDVVAKGMHLAGALKSLPTMGGH